MFYRVLKTTVKSYIYTLNIISCNNKAAYWKTSFNLVLVLHEPLQLLSGKWRLEILNRCLNQRTWNDCWKRSKKIIYPIIISRSSRSKVFNKKPIVYFWHSCFPVNFKKFFWVAFFQNIFLRLECFYISSLCCLYFINFSISLFY